MAPYPWTHNWRSVPASTFEHLGISVERQFLGNLWQIAQFAHIVIWGPADLVIEILWKSGTLTWVIDRDSIDRLFDSGALEVATPRAGALTSQHLFFTSYCLEFLFRFFLPPSTNHIRHGPASITLPIELAPLRAQRVVDPRPEPKHKSDEIIRNKTFAAQGLGDSGKEGHDLVDWVSGASADQRHCFARDATSPPKIAVAQVIQ